jgi:predicted transcriptional regulator of viral defense system
MTKQLELVNDLVAEGCTGFTFQDALARLGTSPAATGNTLRRMTEKGLVDRVNRGHYAIRPLGSLGTSAVSEDLAFAVGAAFQGRAHRIAYSSALSELGLLTHPVRTVFVACTKQVRFSKVSARPLQVVIEQPQTIHIGAEVVGRSWRSTLERALLESAMRVDLVGIETLAEALAMGARDADPARINRLAKQLGPKPYRTKEQPTLQLDPRDPEIAWVDNFYGVAWDMSVDELRAVIEN